MSTPRRLRMSTLLETRDGVPANKDSRLTNCILEMDGSELNVIKRPGFTSYTTPTSGIGYGATRQITGFKYCRLLAQTCTQRKSRRQELLRQRETTLVDWQRLSPCRCCITTTSGGCSTSAILRRRLAMSFIHQLPGQAGQP